MDQRPLDSERAAVLRRELDRLVETVTREMAPERIIVFGSMATGEIHEWSDLDVVVIMETELRPLERVGMILAETWPIVTTDLLVYTPQEWDVLRQTRPFIRDEIDAKGMVIYERSRETVG